MRAAFDDAAVIEHQDAVGVDDAGEPVRQDQGRAPGHQAVERALDDGFVLGIDRRQRLVENEDRRVAQQRPRDRQPLPLSAREPQAALADQSGIALRQRGDEVVRIGGARRRDDLRRRRIRLAEPQIVLDRAVEQISVLPHHGDLPRAASGIERREVGAADAHAARLRIVKPQQQRRDRRLAAAARADDADALADFDVERQPIERLAAPARIGEMHVVERDGRSERRRGP